MKKEEREKGVKEGIWEGSESARGRENEGRSARGEEKRRRGQPFN